MTDWSGEVQSIKCTDYKQFFVDFIGIWCLFWSLSLVPAY